MSSVELSNSTLSKQDLATLDVTKLTALSPEVISRQATINIGTIGHVAHGKSTVVKAVSGVQTVRFKNELERNITIKLDSNGTKGKERSPRTENVARKVKKSQAVTGDDPAKKKRARTSKSSKEVDYEVEKVVEHKVVMNKHLYFVKWCGWEESSNTWEPSEHLDGCHDELFNFLDELTKNNEYDEEEFIKLKRTLSKFKEEDLVKRVKHYVTPKEIKIPVPDPDMTDERLRILSKWPAGLRDPYVGDLLRLELIDEQLYARRQVQLDGLKEWEDEMSSIILRSESSLISVVNNVDLEGPPENFIYINDYLPGENVNIPEDPPFGCSCESNCSGFRKKCCPTITGSQFPYDKDGRVKVPQGVPIYECNKRCKCGAGCNNRVVQRGRTVRLCIFRTSSGCGWGVKTLEDIAKGTFVCEYVGEVITFDEAERRGEKYDRDGQTYLFDLDFNDTNNHPYTVDAAVYGNVSHFVNHSCDPNMTVYAVWANCLDPNLPKLALFANRDIKQGQEISFDYLNQSKSKKNANNVSRSPDSEVNDMKGMLCKCKSKKCRKFYL